MILSIPDILSAQELEKLHTLLDQGEFRDGKLTAGWHAKLVKDNRQLVQSDKIARQAGALLMKALQRNATFNIAVQPRRIRPPLFSRYDEGMAYGAHVDDALMGADRSLRTDVSFTVFLNEPDSYDGGELVMDSPIGEQMFKLPAGSAIVYPSTTLHRVAPVTRGTRQVAVSWVQSLVRNAGQREVLYDLDTARRAIFKKDGKSREFDLLSKSYANLLRLWAET